MKTSESVEIRIFCLLLLSGRMMGQAAGPAVISLVVVEDSDVMLPCSFGSVDIKQEILHWNKDGDKEVFLYYDGKPDYTRQDKEFKGRVFHFPEQLESGNASILIRKTKWTDSGNYTCDFPHQRPTTYSSVSLHVGTAPKPSVKILNQTEEGVLLQCEVNGGSPKPEVEWKDSSGKRLHAVTTRDTETDGKYYITLVTTVNEAGYYRCVSTQQNISHQIYFETYVPIGFSAGWIVAAALGTLIFVAVILVAVLYARGYRISKKDSSTSARSKEEVALNQP